MKNILLLVVIGFFAIALKCNSQPEFGYSSKFYYTAYSDHEFGFYYHAIPSIMCFDLNTGEIAKVLDSAKIESWANSETFVGKYKVSIYDSVRPFLYNINNQKIKELPKIIGSVISVSPDLNYMGFVRGAPGDYPCCDSWEIPVFYNLKTDSLQIIDNYLVNYSDNKFSPDSKKYYFLSSRGKLIGFDTEFKKAEEICTLSNFENLIGNDYIDYNFGFLNNHVVIHMISSSKAWFIDLKKNYIVKYIELESLEDKIIRTFKILDSNYILYSEPSRDTNNYNSSIYISDLTLENKRKISPDDGYHYMLCNAVPFIRENHVVSIRFKVFDFKNEIGYADIIDLNFKTGDFRVIKSNVYSKENSVLVRALQGY